MSENEKRINQLVLMNDIIEGSNNEDILERWYALVGDDEDWDDFIVITRHDSYWDECRRLFVELVKAM